MQNLLFCSFLLVFLATFFPNNLLAQNPIILDQFTADPSARVCEGKIFLYPSHDILAGEGRGRIGWFCMEDYHVFSSDNLVDWTDLGVIVSQDRVSWVNAKSYSMWAPDCIYRDGKYYFYFPSFAKDSSYGRGFSIGVAVSDKPYGPFVPQAAPIKGVNGIDPNPFIDKDGQAYLYWAMRGKMCVSKLKNNMLELASEPLVIQGLPDKGLKEGPYMFERNGVYYLTYPHVQDSTEQLEYAMSDRATGPFKVAGVIMDEALDCWTNQQSIIEFKGQWYLFYHHNDLSPHFDKTRSVRIDSLFFSEDGSIKKVIPTVRGVGITDATHKIQIDRYSLKSDTGASIAFLDTLNRYEGWKAILDTTNAWMQYNGVNFGNPKFGSVDVRATSKSGGTIELRADSLCGPLIAQVEISRSTDWNIVHSPISVIQPGAHNLIVLLKSNAPVEIDWVCFQ